MFLHYISDISVVSLSRDIYWSRSRHFGVVLLQPFGEFHDIFEDCKRF